MERISLIGTNSGANHVIMIGANLGIVIDFL